MNKNEMKVNKNSKIKSWEVHAVWAVEHQITVEALSEKDALEKAFEERPESDDNWEMTVDQICPK